MSKHEPLEALSRAYDREDASQRGEPDPWKDAEDDAEWVSERLACAQVAEAAYLSAARSAPETGKAVVKPLIWKQAAGATVTALAPWGIYAISDGHIELRLNGKLLGYHETLDSAKLAAQADYEQRVLSCLASVAPSGAEPAQAVPEEDVAGLLSRIKVAREYFKTTDHHTTTKLLDDVVAALTSLSAERDEAKLEAITAKPLYSRRVLEEKLTASEAEATSLRRKLEETERERDEARAHHEYFAIQWDEQRIRAESAERKLEEHRKALEDAEDTLCLVEHPAFRDPQYGDEVEALGLRIGFGALMSSASASWREYLATRGTPVGGEYVAGPCHGSVISTLSKIRRTLSGASE